MTMLAAYLHLCLTLIHDGHPTSVFFGVWMMLAPVLLVTLLVAQIVSWHMEGVRNAKREAHYRALIHPSTRPLRVTPPFTQAEIDLWN